MSITVAGIEADELFDGYSKGIAGGPRVEKRYMVPWADGNTFANALMGITNAVAGVPGTIYRTFGHQCPESPNLTALSVGPIEGAGLPTIADGRPEWEWAIVPVVYGVSPVSFGGSFVVPGEPDPGNLFTPDGQAYEFCSFEIDYSSEAITIPKTSMVRSDGPLFGKTIDMLWTVRVATATIVCTVHKVPWLPTDALLDLQQRVNNATFFGRGPETVLFDGAKTRYGFSSDGARTVDIVEVFKYREKGWNKVPRPNDVTQWDPVTHDGTILGRRLYEVADLRSLIFGVTLT